MRTISRCLTPLIAAAAATAGMLAAPTAAADPNLPTCTDVGSGTECATPGNVQLNAAPPIDDQPDYPYPYDDTYWGPALVFGGSMYPPGGPSMAGGHGGMGGGGMGGGGGGHR